VSLSAIPKVLRDQIAERDKGRCSYCHLSQIGQSAVFHVNHVRPKSRGGETEESNLVLQCPYCSLHKSDKIAAIDSETSTEVLLFHPLFGHWQEHFAIARNGTCRGITPTGRATVEALNMNDPLPVIARAIQIHLGLLKNDE
jgi:hypothetical protein